MHVFLRRQVPVIVALIVGLIVGAVTGFVHGVDASTVLRLAFQGAGIGGGLVLLWRFLLVLVSLDPDKPRAMTRQNDSARSYGTSRSKHS